MSRHHGQGKLRRAICPLCQKVVAVYRPTNYAPRDGSDVYRAHRDQTGADCDGVALSVPKAAYVEVP